MGCKLGKDAKLYRNAGTTETPDWTEVTNLTNVRMDGEKALADVTTRGSNGYRQQCTTLKEMTLEFTSQHNPADTHYTHWNNSFFADGTVELLVLTEDKASAEAIGLQATWHVSRRGETQNLEEAIRFDWTLVIAPDTTPTPVTGPIA